jgi:uncharacterized membrane protein (DUF485 family)
MSSTVVNSLATPVDKKQLGVWAGLTSFFLMWSFLYIVLVVFAPGWVCVAVREPESQGVDGVRGVQKVDKTRAFVVALIVTLVVMLIVWLVSATATSK